MPDYKLSKIYKIVNSENSKIYVGSTTRRLLCNRMTGHRRAARDGEELSRFYKAIRRIGIEKFKIELVKEFPCFDKKELEKEECRIIQKVIKRGVYLYNTITEFGRGCVRFQTDHNRWVFQWCPVPGKQKTKSWAVNKYGYEEAKKMAIAYQDKIYPKI
jgi:hypothetical protein